MAYEDYIKYRAYADGSLDSINGYGYLTRGERASLLATKNGYNSKKEKMIYIKVYIDAAEELDRLGFCPPSNPYDNRVNTWQDLSR
jgi:hypothetical protein